MHEEIKRGGKERKGYRVMAGCCQKQSLQFLLPHSLLQCDVLQGGGWIMTQDRARAQSIPGWKNPAEKDEWSWRQKGEDEIRGWLRERGQTKRSIKNCKKNWVNTQYQSIPREWSTSLVDLSEYAPLANSHTQEPSFFFFMLFKHTFPSRCTDERQKTKRGRDFCGSEIAEDVSAFHSPFCHGWKLRGVLKTELQCCSGKWVHIWSELAARSRVFISAAAHVRMCVCAWLWVCVSVCLHGWILRMFSSKQVGLFDCNFLNNCISSRAS